MELHNIVNGVSVPLTPEEIQFEIEKQKGFDALQAQQALVAYKGQRNSAYPSIGDQLDMLWHAMDVGDMARVHPFYETLKAVKAQFPKPTTP